MSAIWSSARLAYGVVTGFLGGSWIVPVALAGAGVLAVTYIVHSIRAGEAERINSAAATRALEVQSEQYSDMLRVQQSQIAELERRRDERAKGAASRASVLRELPRDSGTRLSREEVAALRKLLGHLPAPGADRQAGERAK